MLITIKDLNDLKACKRQVELFQEVFGEAAEINKENILKAFQNELDVHWWCLQIFGSEAYEAAEKPLWKAYLATEKSLWEAYQAARKPFLEAYEAAEKALRDDYLAAIADWIVSKIGEIK